MIPIITELLILDQKMPKTLQVIKRPIFCSLQTTIHMPHVVFLKNPTQGSDLESDIGSKNDGVRTIYSQLIQWYCTAQINL